MRHMSRPLILRLLLILALLATQLGGLTHGIAHVLADQTQDQSLPHNQSCELCAAYAQMGSSIPSSDLSFAIDPAVSSPFALPALTVLPRVFAAFAARAPPRSV